MPSWIVFSSPSLALLTSASTSSLNGSGVSGSAILATFARIDGDSWTQASIRILERPCTRRRTRPSGSFSIRMTAAAVPVS